MRGDRPQLPARSTEVFTAAERTQASCWFWLYYPIWVEPEPQHFGAYLSLREIDAGSVREADIMAEPDGGYREIPTFPWWFGLSVLSGPDPETLDEADPPQVPRDPQELSERVQRAVFHLMQVLPGHPQVLAHPPTPRTILAACARAYRAQHRDPDQPPDPPPDPVLTAQLVAVLTGEHGID